MRGKISNLFLAMVTGGLLLAGAAVAQTTTTTQADPTAPAARTPKTGPGAVDPGHPRVNQINSRETTEQERINAGTRNGQLTPEQTARLNHREAVIQHQERKDMAEHGGHLTKAEQKKLNHELSNVSKHIHNERQH